METLNINLLDLKIGSILAEDIFSNTQFPIAYKEMRVSREVLLVLKAFNINKVLIVKPALDNSMDKTSESLEVNEKKEDSLSFEKRFITSVQKFKVEFLNWESGSKVDLIKVRDVIMPLITEMITDRTKIFMLNDYADSKEYIYYHSVSVALIAAVIADKMGYNRGDVIQVATAAILADSGMAKISKRIRFKPGALTENEFKEVRDHPNYSLKMVKDLQLLKSEMKLAIIQHHERLDGSGYPNSTKGEQISKIAHIIAIADMFHAMTSERLYKKKESVFKAVEIIRESSFGKLYIEVVQALLACVEGLPLGTVVELSNSLIATIVFTNKNMVTRPVVKVEHSDELIDLNQKRNVYIHRIYM
ncbi:HD-GYP domain-containing protein [Kurthia sibirica]|uniref:HD-GYP domain-containing protein n=1 Tax=Kurthia sibirica TaxID=202750 RepID=A0A2U3AMJ5_9BACL|nr:HD-GYP domain-containing protein [Kurthia sibirica]PWI25747.1 HD-GYP domain-containing protein [Kurthia sibirica]GEK35065.1 HD family phosphohydrolase [Kurthia sibirica]